MIKIITGDLLKSAERGEFDVICHGCNIYNTMGSGIAKSIKDKWPEAYLVDCETTSGDSSKLGKITYTKNIPNLTIVNCYTQEKYGRNIQTYADYNAIENSLKEVKKIFPNKKIGMPKIGAGLARGDWNTIYAIIQKVFSDPTDDVTIVEWEQDVNSTSSASNNQTSQGGSANTNYGNQTGAIAKLSAFSSKPQIQAKQAPVVITNTTTPPAKKKFRGKRKCKVCNTSHPVREMHNYFHSIWVCKGKCHGDFQNRINQINTLESIRIAASSSPSNATTNIPSPVLSNDPGN